MLSGYQSHTASQLVEIVVQQLLPRIQFGGNVLNFLIDIDGSVGWNKKASDLLSTLDLEIVGLHDIGRYSECRCRSTAVDDSSDSPVATLFPPVGDEAQDPAEPSRRTNEGY